MIYLEKLLNRELSSPLVIWNSVIIKKKVSAGRESKWGLASLCLAVLFCTVLYGGITFWIYTENGEMFAHSMILRIIYLTIVGVIYAASIFQIWAVLAIVKNYTPENIEELAKQLSRA